MCCLVSSGNRRISLGRRGEEIVARYLEQEGFRIVERNWRAPSGELDIVAMDGETLVFVEVRTRMRADRIPSSEWFPLAKQRKLVALAERYLCDREPCSCRFDAVGVTLSGIHPTITHYRAAFGVE